MKKFIFIVLCFLHLLVGEVFGAQIPAMFVFGDSLIDPGNNNNRKTIAKAVLPPYGIDFPAGITGRFCNGGTIADYLGFNLGFDLIPKIDDVTTQGSKDFQGVNFASAAAGILSDTGKGLGQIIPLPDQVDIFGNMVIPSLASQELSFNGQVLSTEDFLAKSLFFSNMGNNDLLNTYLLPISNPLRKPIAPDFFDSIIANYTILLKTMYKYGARNFLVTGVAPLGCVPLVIKLFIKEDMNECYEPNNEASKSFNVKMKSMIQQLNKDLPSAHFLFWDIYSLLIDVINNPSPYGIKNTKNSCCGGVSLQLTCLPTTVICPNRDEFIFWDEFHPTDVINKLGATIAYQGTLQNTYPINVKQLLNL